MVAGVVVLFAVLAIVLYYLCVYKPKKQADGLLIKNGGTHSGSASDLLNTGMHPFNNPNPVGDLITLGLTVLFHVIYPIYPLVQFHILWCSLVLFQELDNLAILVNVLI